MLSDCIKLIIAAVRLQLRSYPANRAAPPPPPPPRQLTEPYVTLLS